MRKKQIRYDFTYMRDPLESNSERQKVEGWVPRVGGGGSGELSFNGDKAAVSQDERVPKIGGSDGHATM